MSNLCYLGHEDCYDEHAAERRSDEADYLADLDRDYTALGYWPEWNQRSVKPEETAT